MLPEGRTDGILIDMPLITLDCAEHSITGNGAGKGIWAYYSGGRSTVKRCTVRDFETDLRANWGNWLSRTRLRSSEWLRRQAHNRRRSHGR